VPQEGSPPLERCHPLVSQSPHVLCPLVILFLGKRLAIKFQRSTTVTADQMLLSATLYFTALYSILQALTNQQPFQVVKYNCPHFTGAEPDPGRLRDLPKAEKTIGVQSWTINQELLYVTSSQVLQNSIPPHVLLQYKLLLKTEQAQAHPFAPFIAMGWSSCFFVHQLSCNF